MCGSSLKRLATDARGVRVHDLDDGLARLIADLPAPLAYAIHDRLTQTARHVRDTRDAMLDGERVLPIPRMPTSCPHLRHRPHD